MRRVANLYPIIAEQLVDRLQAGSIPASATQNLDTSGYPVFPLHGLWTVWIPDDADVHEAMRITKAFIEALPPPRPRDSLGIVSKGRAPREPRVRRSPEPEAGDRDARPPARQRG